MRQREVDVEIDIGRIIGKHFWQVMVSRLPEAKGILIKYVFVYVSVKEKWDVEGRKMRRGL